MASKKIVLLKLTGEIFPVDANKMIDGSYFAAFAKQIKELEATHIFGIVIGGGNFFRGTQQGNGIGIEMAVSHQIGMLATVMNSLIIENVLKKAGVNATVFCALPIPTVGSLPSQQAIDHAMNRSGCIIFGGGIGTPYFTTDTAALVRALQIKAPEVWKCTSVAGIYSEDPKSNSNANFIEKISYDQALEQKLTFMDSSALCLGRDHKIVIRVFNIFEPNALQRAASQESFGSRVTPS